MRSNLRFLSTFIFSLLALAVLSSIPAHGQTITCSSDDGKRNYCSANTRGGVQMVNQRSGSPCIQGQTWGWNNNQIWVDKGCRADFAVGNNGGWNGGGWNGGNNGQTITCSSDDGRRNYCNANTRGGVQMVNQRSGSPCIQGQTWGWNNNQIWVDKGCRADFATGNGNGGGWNGGGWNGGGNNSQTITCSSDNGGRNYCSANTRGGVQMVNQRSGSPCIQGQTWGWNNNQIWVDKGCRADFAVGNGNGNGNGNGWGFGNGWKNNAGVNITCSSDDGGRRFCNFPNGTNPRNVVLTNQRSGSPCIQNQTWGWNNNQVWVDKGCRADFQTTR